MDRMTEIYSARPLALLTDARNVEVPTSEGRAVERISKQPPRVDAGLLVLRLALGTIVLFHGVFKLTHGVGWIGDLLQRHGLPGFAAYGVYVAEVAAPFFLFAGAFTRLAALTMVFDMTMAIVLSAYRGILHVNGGGGWGIEVEAMILLDALALTLAGGGRYSIDFYRGTGRAAGSGFKRADDSVSANTSSASSTLPKGAET
jgi:putative oxidoreductase